MTGRLRLLTTGFSIARRSSSSSPRRGRRASEPRSERSRRWRPPSRPPPREGGRALNVTSTSFADASVDHTPRIRPPVASAARGRIEERLVSDRAQHRVHGPLARRRDEVCVAARVRHDLARRHGQPSRPGPASPRATMGIRERLRAGTEKETHRGVPQEHVRREDPGASDGDSVESEARLTRRVSPRPRTSQAR